MDELRRQDIKTYLGFFEEKSFQDFQRAPFFQEAWEKFCSDIKHLHIPGYKKANTDKIYQFILDHENKQIDILGSENQPIDKSGWTRERHIARLLLTWQKGDASDRMCKFLVQAHEKIQHHLFWYAMCSLHTHIWYERCIDLRAKVLAQRIVHSEKYAAERREEEDCVRDFKVVFVWDEKADKTSEEGTMNAFCTTVYRHLEFHKVRNEVLQKFRMKENGFEISKFQHKSTAPYAADEEEWLEFIKRVSYWDR